ncbi:MAG: hypothetical protein ACM37W_24280 [Actinomycetota bacterium]
MSYQELATKTGLNAATIRVKASQMGIDPNNISPQQESQLLSAIGGSEAIALPQSEVAPVQPEEPPVKPKRGRKKSGEIVQKKAENLQQSQAATASTEEHLLQQSLLQRFENGRVMGRLEALAEERGKEEEYLAAKTEIAVAKIEANQELMAGMVAKFLDPDFFAGTTVQESYHTATLRVKSSADLLQELRTKTSAQTWVNPSQE